MLRIDVEIGRPWIQRVCTSSNLRVHTSSLLSLDTTPQNSHIFVVKIICPLQKLFSRDYFELEPCREMTGACCEPDDCRTNLSCGKESVQTFCFGTSVAIAETRFGGKTYGLRLSAVGGVTGAAGVPFPQTSLGSYEDQEAWFHTFISTLCGQENR